MAGRNDDPKPSAASAEEGGFLGRWSRRKAEARAAEQSEESETAALEPHDGDDALPPFAESDEPQGFDVNSLPDIDSLGATSDFSVFMQAGVPSELRTKALRKLWRLKSELANLDGLLDYGEDLTGSFKVVDHLKTAYEVGRGFLRDEPDPSAEAEAEVKAEREAKGEITDGDALSADAEPAAETPATDPLESEPEQELDPLPDPVADPGKALKQEG